MALAARSLTAPIFPLTQGANSESASRARLSPRFVAGFDCEAGISSSRKLKMGLSALDRLRLPIFRSKNSQLILRALRRSGTQAREGLFSGDFDDGGSRRRDVLVRMDHEADHRQDIYRKEPPRDVGDRRRHRRHLYRQRPRHLRPASGDGADRQQHHRRDPDTHLRQDAGYGPELFRRPPFDGIHRPPILHRGIGVRRPQPHHHGARPRCADDAEPDRQHVHSGPVDGLARAGHHARRGVRRAHARQPRKERRDARVPGLFRISKRSRKRRKAFASSRRSRSNR